MVLCFLKFPKIFCPSGGKPPKKSSNARDAISVLFLGMVAGDGVLFGLYRYFFSGLCRYLRVGYGGYCKPHIGANITDTVCVIVLMCFFRAVNHGIAGFTA